MHRWSNESILFYWFRIIHVTRERYDNNNINTPKALLHSRLVAFASHNLLNTHTYKQATAVMKGNSWFVDSNFNKIFRQSKIVGYARSTFKLILDYFWSVSATGFGWPTRTLPYHLQELKRITENLSLCYSHRDT